MASKMAESTLDLYFGPASIHTCLGGMSETVAGLDAGRSGLAYQEKFGMYAGLLDMPLLESYTRFESAVIGQIQQVLDRTELKLSDSTVQLVLSTTKGNIGLLAEATRQAAVGMDEKDGAAERVVIPERTFLYTAAEAVVRYFDGARKPIVISNACISGVSAFVVAQDLLRSGEAEHVLVVGCDVLSEFITAGFASFKSIGRRPCRPYDSRRDGLTLGEACGAVLLTTDPRLADPAGIRLVGGAMTNDANHISGPSRTGDGLYYAIRNAMREAGGAVGQIGFVNAHGTATRYNDEMESKAMAWAGLETTPLNSLKGYIGHTLGASGVVETILCIEQLKRGYIWGTVDFESSDTPHALQVSAGRQVVSVSRCIKTASGFGGCNAAIVLEKKEPVCSGAPMVSCDVSPMDAEIHRRDGTAVKLVADYRLPVSNRPFAGHIRALFKAFGQNDMKFYKMSDMSKGLYVAVEHLLEEVDWSDTDPVRRAIVLSNRSASLDADLLHQLALDRHLPEGPSPSVFVYTLANVAVGEMCIRHKIQGYNIFFVENENSGWAEQYASRLIATNRADAVICGWCEYLQGNWDIYVKLLKKQSVWNN